MASTRTNQKSSQKKTGDDAKTKVAQPTDAERKAGIIARRKVRATGHVIERIDGKLNDLGTEGGRWIVRVIDTGKITRHESYAAMVEAGRKGVAGHSPLRPCAHRSAAAAIATRRRSSHRMRMLGRLSSRSYSRTISSPKGVLRTSRGQPASFCCSISS